MSVFGGLFSGNKKSATTNSTTTNNSSSIGIQGDLSGILGDGNKLFTDNSETDNSTTIDWRQDNYSEVDNSNNSDNSDNSSRDFEGQFAGAMVGGNLTVTGDGAWLFGEKALQFADNTVQTALNNSTEQSYVAIKAAQDTAKEALDFGRYNVGALENTSRYAIDSTRTVSRDAIEGVLEATANANKSLENTALQLANMTKGSTEQAIQASNEAMAKNAALIQTTALGGQDLMIDAMKKVLMWGGGFLAVAFVAMNMGRAK